MLKFEYNEMFQKVYNEALKYNPFMENVTVVVNTHCISDGVSVGKGTAENEGQYRISCHGDDNDPLYTVSSFALGLAMVIYDVRYGEYDYMTMSPDEKEEFNRIFHEFYPDSDKLENIIMNTEEDNG